MEELLDLFVNKIIMIPILATAGTTSMTTGAWPIAMRDSKESEYGLDLEASWLITEAASAWDGSGIPAIRRASLALVDHALRYGFDKEHGGVYRYGPRRSRQKTWTWNGGNSARLWLACSTLINSRGIRSTGKPSILKPASSWSAFVDHQFGEVYTAISHDGKIDDEKVGPWKPVPCHPCMFGDYLAIGWHAVVPTARRARTPVAPLTT